MLWPEDDVFDYKDFLFYEVSLISCSSYCLCYKTEHGLVKNSFWSNLSKTFLILFFFRIQCIWPYLEVTDPFGVQFCIR